MCHLRLWQLSHLGYYPTMNSTISANKHLADGSHHTAPLAFVLVFCTIGMAALAPLTVIDVPFLADYPNHLARMHILGNLNNDVWLSDRYASQFDLIPNLAMDVIVPWLAKVMPLETAGQAFLALILLSTLASVSYLYRVLFERWSLWPLTAGLLLYHGSFMAGLINFSLGVSLVPGALGLWIALRYASPAMRMIVGMLLAFTLFFCHIIAFGAYGLMVLSYEYVRARDRWSRRDGPRKAVQDILVVGLTGLVPTWLFLRQLWADQENVVGDAMIFGDWTWKAKALLSPFANYQLGLDLVSFALLGGLVLFGWRSGMLVIARRLGPGLAALMVGFLVAPKGLWTGGLFDQRFVILFCLLLIGSSDCKLQSQALRTAVFSGLALLFAVRVGLVFQTWTEHRQDLDEVRSAIAQVDEGSKILVIQPDKTAGVRLAPDRHMVLHHAAQMASLPALAIIEKSSFVSTIYAIPGQQPLRLLDPFDDLGRLGASTIPTLADLHRARQTGADWPIKAWWRDFDYVMLIFGYGQGAERLKGDLPLDTLMDGDILDLYEIKE